MNVEIVLGSAVLSAAISGIISYMSARKNDKLHYITNERKKWRNEIREISKQLNGASYKKTVHILTELKVRINAFGANGCSKQYKNDAHIWEVINKIENDKCNKEDLRRKQNQLIEYLVLLLKDDWERSKREVKGDKYFFASIIFFLAAGIFFCGLASYYLTSNNDLSIFSKMGDIVGYLLCMALPILILPIISMQIGEQLLDGIIRDKGTTRNIWWLALAYGICGISLISMILLNYFSLSRFYNLISRGKDVVFFVTIFLQLFACGFQYVQQANELERKYFYYRAINLINGKYKKEELQNKENLKK